MLDSCDCALELSIAQQYHLRSEDGLILHIIFSPRLSLGL
jgi:hypothetical protein